MKSIKDQLKSIATELDKGNLVVASVSKKGTYWHLDHSLRVIEGVLETLITSKPEDFSPRINFWKKIILLTGYIPRGKGKAPKQVVPLPEISKDDLLKRLESIQVLLSKSENTHKKAHFNHPLFKDLNKKQTLRFLRIHTHHHLKIIADINKRAN
ncbi:hypothetical protein JCM19294_1404 [Nonlabens tegetincola]|uniref:DUF1569 domain-containing protein n=1 Tax=Nonlabens tegetincola TaxID=323273 RepID=A0A090Q6I7_9FLAO|nr:hypothetical protein [Nonlabens tegetincola]GAK97358.1 hypothetical protein JCM19294_1404 [Nonlabens tegetincola]